MDLQVDGLEDLEDRLGIALDRIGELQAGTRVRSDGFFSQPFMADHTQYDSFGAFCEHSPWELEEGSDIQTVPRGQLDEYVASTTDFDTWEEMKTQAAEEEIVEQVLS